MLAALMSRGYESPERATGATAATHRDGTPDGRRCAPVHRPARHADRHCGRRRSTGRRIRSASASDLRSWLPGVFAQSRSCRELASWPAHCGSGRIRHYNDVAT
jgi:hypothetical protein